MKRTLGCRVLTVVALAAAVAIPAVAVRSGPTQAAARPPQAPAVAPATSLAPTPPMGFNDWNAFGCDVSEALIEQTADLFVTDGFKAAGYQYVNIDDCWSLRERGSDGRLVPDPVKFPHGIAGVADYVHSKGLKLGIYGDAGTKTCAGYPGSLGKEALDAQTWADWGVDYLKYDNCNNQSDGSQQDFIRRYTAMRDALDKVGRPIVFSICEWGQSQPWTWGAGIGDLWRTTGDISDNWSSLRSIIAQNAPLAPFAGPGHFNDPDMLQIGNGGMTDTEYRTHMSIWSMMAAPLIMGTDLRRASPATLAILRNSDIIAIDQDPLGVQAAVVADAGGLMAFDKPLADGDRAIALYNSTDALATVSVPVSATGLATVKAKAFRLQDVWTGAVVQAASTIAASVPAHGTVVYRVRREAKPQTLAPAVTVGGSLATLVPGPAGAGTLTTTVANRGWHGLRHVTVSAEGPAGWTVTPTTASGKSTLKTDASIQTSWTVTVPPGTSAGSYPLTLTATYEWGTDRTAATSRSELIAVVVTAPADGRYHLSSVLTARSTNAVGPVELDQSNGGPGQGDGALITMAGQVYTRGLGTSGPSEIVYYLGGRCSQLVTSVGIDDEASTAVPATFTVYADDTVAAASGSVAAGEPPKELTADLTGANWLRLVTTGSAAAPDGTTVHVHTDWAVPVLTCGAAGPTDPVSPVERTLFSFESGTDGFYPANADPGGSVAQSTAFHTDGEHGLAVAVPSSGNWFGATAVEPLDLTGTRRIKYDVKTAASGTSGEIALQVGPNSTWCQGGLWAWANPNSSRTIAENVSAISCPSGVTLDLSQVHAVWVFVNGTGAVVDNIRAE